MNLDDIYFDNLLPLLVLGITPPLDVFTEALEARVKVFQTAVGLRVDGVIGVRTLQALNDKLGSGLTSSRALRGAIERFGIESCR